MAASLRLEVLVEALEVVRPRATGTQDDVASIVAHLAMLIDVSVRQMTRQAWPYLLIIDGSLFLALPFGQTRVLASKG